MPTIFINRQTAILPWRGRIGSHDMRTEVG